MGEALNFLAYGSAEKPAYPKIDGWKVVEVIHIDNLAVAGKEECICHICSKKNQVVIDLDAIDCDNISFHMCLSITYISLRTKFEIFF
jgi:hypothetical protein